MNSLWSRSSETGVGRSGHAVNRNEINFINTIDEALSYLHEVGKPNLRIMADTYHMSIEEVDLSALERAGELIGYVHVADSNRHAPGSGTFDYPAFFDTLKAIGYDGWCTVECLPVPDPVTAAQKSMDYLGRWLHSPIQR